MGRRGENIRKRADGRWEARIVQGAPVNGCTNYKYLYGRSYQEVRKKKKVFLDNLQAVRASSETQGKHEPAPMPSTIPFGQAAEAWLESKSSVVRESTLAYYTIMVNNHLLPAFGNSPLGEINEKRLADFLSDARVRGHKKNGGRLRDKTLADIKTMLMQILTYGKLRGWITEIPQCPAIPVKTSPIRVLSQREQEELEAILLQEEKPFFLGVLVSLYGGLRIGEVCALKWSAFDEKNGTVHVQHTVSRIRDVRGEETRTKVVVGSPKTACSLRTVPLPDTIFQYFMKQKRDGETYLVTGTAKMMEPRVCLERYKRLLQRAGLEDYTFHTLRHTFATRCVECGVDIKSLSEIMGHSNVKITMQRYVHPSMDSKKSQINRLPCFAASGQNRGQNADDIPEV